MEQIFLELFKSSPIMGILGVMYYYQRKDYTKLVEDTRSESKKREETMQKTIDKNQDIINDLANKFNVVEDVKDKVVEIEQKVNTLLSK